MQKNMAPGTTCWPIYAHRAWLFVALLSVLATGCAQAVPRPVPIEQRLAYVTAGIETAYHAVNSLVTERYLGASQARAIILRLDGLEEAAGMAKELSRSINAAERQKAASSVEVIEQDLLAIQVFLREVRKNGRSDDGRGQPNRRMNRHHFIGHAFVIPHHREGPSPWRFCSWQRKGWA